MDLFKAGFGEDPDKKKNLKKGVTFTQPSGFDGAVEVETTEAGVNFAQQMAHSFDLDAMPTDEFELLVTYRQLALQQEIDEAIQEICNEAIIQDDMKSAVSVVLDDIEDMSDGIKDKIRDEFDHILKLLKFKSEGYGVFRRWYIDGRVYYHKVIDKSSAKKGIVDIIPIDPINIKLVREFTKKQQGQADIYDLADVKEYFVFSKRPFIEMKGDANTFAHNNVQGLKIPRDAVTYVPSGILSSDGRLVLSYLYKSIKPFNNLKLMEDSLVIYRVTRAPERRMFYVDVGNLPKGKAEQYLKDIMNRFRNKIVYDVNKGTINTRKKFQTMMEDYWLPRREGGRGTEVTTLPGGQNLGELEDVNYVKDKLYRSLNVPLSRFQQDSTAFNIGRTTEITRDEIKFSKFISRLRKKFSMLFDDLLKTQLLLKKIITEEEWMEIEELISYDFLEDNYFQELKELEILSDRIEAVTNVMNSGAVGKYFSHDYVRRNVLRQTEDDIEEEDKKMEEEKDDPKYKEEEEFGEDGNDNPFGGGDEEEEIESPGGGDNEDPENVKDQEEADKEAEKADKEAEKEAEKEQQRQQAKKK